MPLFPQPQHITQQQNTAAKIDGQLQLTAGTMLSAYNEIRRLVYNNPEVGDADAVYAAFAQYTATGLTPTQLGQAARIIKTVINSFAPGTIVDEVPEVTIT